MRYDVEMIQQACDEAGLVAERTQDPVQIQVASGVTLRFQNAEREEDRLVGFRDTPWHVHDGFAFIDPRGCLVEMYCLEVIFGLADGTILICERPSQDLLDDRWLIHKDYSDEFDCLEESDTITVWRARKRMAS